MATRKSHTSLSSNPVFLLEYIDNLPDESDSDEEFEGYLGPDDGPVTYCNDHYPEDYDCYSDILTRSRSLDSLTEIEREREQLHSTESPLHRVSPPPFKGAHPSVARTAPLTTAPPSPLCKASMRAGLLWQELLPIPLHPIPLLQAVAPASPPR